MKQLNTKQLRFFYLLLSFLYLFSLFFNLGEAPLNLEEPRRALVALEMLFNNNFIVTTLLNETFYDHPPLWNIILAMSMKLFGYSNFAVRLPCALSLVLTGVVVLWAGKKYVGTQFGLLSAFYYLISVDLYFFFSTIAEIDIFYSLLILLSILSVFHFYEKRNFWFLFFSAYFWVTLAFFTKGVVSFVFLGITVLVYFWYKKNLKAIFSPAHILAMLASFLLIGIYFYSYGTYENLELYISEMWSLTSNRTALGRGVSNLWLHPFKYIANIFAIIFPATLFLLFLFKKKAISSLKSQPYIWFLSIVSIANIIPYLLSSGARVRYAYMFFPMIITILVYALWINFQKERKKHTIYFSIIQVLNVIVGIACFILPFVAFFHHVPYLKYSLPFLGLLLMATFFINKRATGIFKHMTVFLCFILMRIGYDFVVPFMKSEKSSSAVHRSFANEIHAITQNKPVFLISNDKMREYEEIPFNFYRLAASLEMSSEKIVTKKKGFDLNGFYILNKNNNFEKTPLFEFTIDGVDLVLVAYFAN